jgi:hypothetical protein
MMEWSGSAGVGAESAVASVGVLPIGCAAAAAGAGASGVAALRHIAQAAGICIRPRRLTACASEPIANLSGPLWTMNQAPHRHDVAPHVDVAGHRLPADGP